LAEGVYSSDTSLPRLFLYPIRTCGFLPLMRSMYLSGAPASLARLLDHTMQATPSPSRLATDICDWLWISGKASISKTAVLKRLPLRFFQQVNLLFPR